MLLLPRRGWVFIKQNGNAIQLKPFHDTDEELHCSLVSSEETFVGMSKTASVLHSLSTQMSTSLPQTLLSILFP